MASGVAFGGPGMEPRWTRSAKEGIGTAYHTSCRVWFTLSHGIINEIYYPNVDCPNTRDLQFLITDQETFCHEERRDLLHEIEYPEKGTLYYRLTNTDPAGRYRTVKDVITDPHSSVVLMRTRFEVNDAALKKKLKAYALLAPHMKGLGQHNFAECADVEGRLLLHAQREGAHLAFGAEPEFVRRSIGFVGFSDGWQDLMNDFRMDWQFCEAPDGNVALTAELDLSRGLEVVIAVAFGRSSQSASTKLLQSLAVPFDEHLAGYLRQWRRTAPANNDDVSRFTGDEGHLYRLSRMVLLAHEDKVYPGALVASMSIPWGETKGDADLGGYHLVWPRDMVKSATALLATGQTSTPRRSLIWLACLQDADGGVPQNSWINGDAYWHGRQLDEVAAPILLAWRLRAPNALGLFDPVPLVERAARYLLLHGPVTGQERWEENSGCSPSTLASIIAALVCAADFESGETKQFVLDYADWLASHIEDWTVTNAGELVPGISRHYIRITPADPSNPDDIPAPDRAMLQVANGGGLHPARNVVGTEFLDLVRLGIRSANDPLITDSIKVIDAILRRELPQGPCWRRYNHDGYGQKADGDPFDGEGVGSCWPLLTGERGHYELAAGRDPSPYIRALEQFSNEGGMLPEQVWDEPDLPEARMFIGKPTGSAMPLCWAHAEYLMLVRSFKDGRIYEQPPLTFDRYVKQTQGSDYEMWTLAHQIQKISSDKNLRIILAADGLVHWSADGWSTAYDLSTKDSGFGCFYVDIGAAQMTGAHELVFTLKLGEKWIGRDFRVEIVTGES
jgi:glucoamylase